MRPVSLGVNAASVASILALIRAFDPAEGGVQLVERGGPGSIYHLGVDGVSLPLLLLGSVLNLAACLGVPGGREQVARPRSFHAWTLLLLGAVNGVFLAQDWALFYICWELTLIPLFFLIGLWGGAQRSAAGLTFLLYTMGGSTFTLLAMLAMKLLLGLHSYAMEDFCQAARAAPPHDQALFFLIFSLGFAVKIPLLPLHGWQPLTYAEAPAPVTLLLAGVLSKMGVYGLIRTAQTLPAGAEVAALPLAVIGVAAGAYGALLAWRKIELRRMIAWSSISHMGVVLLGLSTLRADGWGGAALQSLCHGLSIGALLLCAGWIERRHGPWIGPLAGRLRSAPRAALAVTLALLASMSLPGTGSFIAEVQVLSAALDRWGPAIAPISLGALIWAATAARTVDHLIAAPEQGAGDAAGAGAPDGPGGPPGGSGGGAGDMDAGSLLGAALLLGLLVAVGIFPDAALSRSVATLRQITGLWPPAPVSP